MLSCTPTTPIGAMYIYFMPHFVSFFYFVHFTTLYSTFLMAASAAISDALLMIS